MKQPDRYRYCHKQAYSNRSTALAEIERNDKKKLARGGRPNPRREAYWCDTCAAFHIRHVP